MGEKTRRQSLDGSTVSLTFTSPGAPLWNFQIGVRCRHERPMTWNSVRNVSSVPTNDNQQTARGKGHYELLGVTLWDVGNPEFASRL